MQVAVQAKFEQNDDIKQVLINTGGSHLVDCNRFDKFWSNGLNLHDKEAHMKNKWKGQNALGEILITVRENLK